jgi:hypothetical protein
MRKIVIVFVLALASVPGVAQQVWQQPRGQVREVRPTPEMQAHDKVADALTARVNKLKREDAAEQ